MTDPWNPAQYARFRREREQPLLDLIAMAQPSPGMRIVDLGCGTGAGVRLLHSRLQARETVGIDRSARMLEEARRSGVPPGVAFEPGDIAQFDAHGEYDLIFSNAAFHWIDDHAALIPKLIAALKPGGQLLFQVPASHDDPSHTAAEALTAIEPFASAFAGWHRPQPVLTPEEYARLLYRNGLPEPSVRLVVYPHVLEGPEEVVEWMKGTLLTEYERHLPADLFPRFLAAYRDRLLAKIENTRPYFFPFKRILCWGRKPAPGWPHAPSPQA